MRYVNATTESNMKTLTIRNLPPDVSEALEREKRRRGESLNQTVIELLSQGLGVGGTRSNGLAGLAGNWSEEVFRQFEDAVSLFGEVDPELWR
jgi:plasmid stability protein